MAPHVQNPARSAPTTDLFGQPITSTQYSAAFEQAWAAYPKRHGGNNKQAAYRAWHARRTAGFTSVEMIAGVERYAAHIRAIGREGTEFVKQAATFFGPCLHFKDDFATEQPLPTRGGKPDPAQQLLAFYATERCL